MYLPPSLGLDSCPLSHKLKLVGVVKSNYSFPSTHFAFVRVCLKSCLSSHCRYAWHAFPINVNFPLLFGPLVHWTAGGGTGAGSPRRQAHLRKQLILLNCGKSCQSHSVLMAQNHKLCSSVTL